MTHPLGRQPIGVVQPPDGGAEYPFVSPSADIQQLFGDFYLCYQDDYGQRTLPLRVAWLYGFGSNSVSPPAGFPTPTHAYDLVVKDADGTTVFDSTAATTFKQVDWGSRLRVLEWRTDSSVCRCTIHTEWSPDDTPITYDDYIEPENGVLDPRTYERLPKRVRGLRVGLVRLSDGPAVLKEGYNITLTPEQTTRVDGSRRVDRITIAAIPGAGLGRSPGCDEVEPVLRRINQIGPGEESGNFLLDPKDCYYSRLLVSAAGNVAGYAHEGLSEEEARAGLQLGNTCAPCCECNDFVRVYKGIQATDTRWRLLGGRAADLRDTYHDMLERWNTEKACREAAPLRVVLSPGLGCHVGIGASYCNNFKCCLTNVEVRFTFRLYTNGLPSGGTPDITISRARISGSSTDGDIAAVVGGTWPSYTLTHPYQDQKTQSLSRLWLKLNGCTSAQTLVVYVTVHIPNPEPSSAGDVCVLPTPNVSAVSGLWSPQPTNTARYIETKASPLNPSFR